MYLSYEDVFPSKERPIPLKGHAIQLAWPFAFKHNAKQICASNEVGCPFNPTSGCPFHEAETVLRRNQAMRIWPVKRSEPTLFGQATADEVGRGQQHPKDEIESQDSIL